MSPGVLVAGGGCAGALAWAVATPMDVIKARLQAGGQRRQRYRGLLHCVLTSVREEGPRVLFKGCCSTAAVPSPSIWWCSWLTRPC